MAVMRDQYSFSCNQVIRLWATLGARNMLRSEVRVKNGGASLSMPTVAILIGSSHSLICKILALNSILQAVEAEFRVHAGLRQACKALSSAEPKQSD